MPLPNFHSCRLAPPGKFQKGSFRTIAKGRISIIIGRLLGKDTTSAQAYRYDKSKWDADAAQAHCARHGGTFHKAEGGE